MTQEPPPTPGRLLLVSAEDREARWFASLLQQSTIEAWRVTRVRQVSEAATALGPGGFDVVVVDLASAEPGSPDAVARLAASGTGPAVVLVGAEGAPGRELETLRAGAQDLLERESLNPGGLARALRYAHERHRLRRELAAQRDRRQRLFDSASAAIVQLDADGRPVLLNLGAVEVLGHPAGELVASPWLARAAPAPADTLPRRLRAAAAAHGPAAFECVVFPASGPTRRVAWRTRPLGDGAAAGLLAVGLDVTRTRELRHRLWHTETLASLGHLLSAVADELCSATASMRAGLDACTGIPATHAGDAALIETQLERLERLSNSLTDYGQPLGSGISELDPAEAARRAIEKVRPAARARGVRLQLSLSPLAVRIAADPDSLLRALERILLNAVQFSPRDATVTLRVGPAPDAGVEFSTLDEGPGFEGDVGGLFEPFHTTLPGASGLGLAVAERIAAAHGGRLGVEGPEGGGARVWLRLPGVRPGG